MTSDTAPPTSAHAASQIHAPYSQRRLNRLAVGLGARSYLEIGIEAGETFRAVEVPDRSGVDPVISPQIAPIANASTRLYGVTSDAFFASLPAEQTFDLIFIDGLHTFEQTYRDLCNALLHSHPRSVILIDDTKPTDVYSSLRDQQAAYRFRSMTGSSDRNWHGDTFKVVFALHDFHPGLDYRTMVDPGSNPQTLVWRSSNLGRTPMFDSFEKISRLTYFDLLERIDILQPAPEDEAIGLALSVMGGRSG